MLVSELIEKTTNRRRRNALNALFIVTGDVELPAAYEYTKDGDGPEGMIFTTWMTYRSVARGAIGEALGLPKGGRRRARQEIDTDDELWRACLVALLPTHQVGEAVERADKAVAAWRRRVQNR